MRNEWLWSVNPNMSNLKEPSVDVSLLLKGMPTDIEVELSANEAEEMGNQLILMAENARRRSKLVLADESSE